VIKYQIKLVKAGTSAGANYREANRAESRNDFIHKIAIVEKEALERVNIGWRFATRRVLATINKEAGYYKKLVNCWLSL